MQCLHPRLLAYSVLPPCICWHIACFFAHYRHQLSITGIAQTDSRMWIASLMRVRVDTCEIMCAQYKQKVAYL